MCDIFKAQLMLGLYWLLNTFHSIFWDLWNVRFCFLNFPAFFGMWWFPPPIRLHCYAIGHSLARPLACGLHPHVLQLLWHLPLGAVRSRPFYVSVFPLDLHPCVLSPRRSVWAMAGLQDAQISFLDILFWPWKQECCFCSCFCFTVYHPNHF